jgi:integrase
LPRIKRWKHLLEQNDDFRRWYDNLSRGSRNTAELNARTLYRFSSLINMTPTQIVDFTRDSRKEFEDLLLDFVTKLRDEGKTPSYIENYLTCVRSWLRFNDLILVRKINIGNTNLTPTIENERIPTKTELKQIITYAPDRGRCSISFMAFSGVRPQVLGDITGSKGLEIRDLPELEIKGKEVSFSTIPAQVLVSAELSKAKHKYFTFLGDEGCEYLKIHLEKRLAEGEKIGPKSAIITYKKGYHDTGFSEETVRVSKHISRKTISKEIRDAMRPRFTWRPYVLRAYFDTQLLLAESNGKIPHAYRQFFMGHKGDIEARYTTNKGRLPEDLIEDMREAYRRSLEYLKTSNRETSTETLQETVRKELLLVAGYTGEEIESMDLRVHDNDFQEMVRQKMVGSMVNNGNSQRLVNVEDVEEFLNRGWHFVAKLTDEKVIIRLP